MPVSVLVEIFMILWVFCSFVEVTPTMPLKLTVLIFFNIWGLANQAIKNPAISGRVNISRVHLDTLGMNHNLRLIADIVSYLNSKLIMNS
jgi:hypothetical protein